MKNSYRSTHALFEVDQETSHSMERAHACIHVTIISPLDLAALLKGGSFMTIRIRESAGKLIRCACRDIGRLEECLPIIQRHMHGV